MINQEKLKEVLNYNPETGIFTWKKKISVKVVVGRVAGCVTGNGYRRIRVDGKLYLAHRLAWLYMTSEWPKHQIDHMNHSRDDNRFINLREATNLENHKNKSMSVRNKSGVNGVIWSKRDGVWLVRITVYGTQNNLGSFNDKFEAICARLSANNKYGFHANHGEKR